MKTRKHRRGSAEIELILIIPILMLLLLLMIASMKIGAARLGVAGSASYEAFHNSTAEDTPQYTGDTPVLGIESVYPSPELPNRVHEPTENASVTNKDGQGGIITTKVGSKAAIISPAWTYSSYPVGSADQQMLDQWFTTYVDESQRNAMTYPLGLSPEWTP